MGFLEQLQGFQPLILTMISTIFIMSLLMNKDELEQQALNNALKSSILITVVGIVGYLFYLMLNGNTTISIYSIIHALEAMSILTILFYFIALTGFGFRFKLRSKIIANILLFLSIIISIVATASIVLNLELFANSVGILRYDELLLFTNVLMLGLIIPILPKSKKLYNDEYYKIHKQVNKGFNLAIIIYLVCLAMSIGVIVYSKFM